MVRRAADDVPDFLALHGRLLLLQLALLMCLVCASCGLGGMTLLNFVSNHDVIRLASVLKEPAHYTLATAALLLLPGMPAFYYGDEFGVEVCAGANVVFKVIAYSCRI